MSDLVPPSDSPVSASSVQQGTETTTPPTSLEEAPKPSLQQPLGYATVGRRAHKKSRTGCSTCKSRKIKTYTTLTADPSVWEFWRDDVVQLGLTCDYIMRAVLAVSALHLAYHQPDRRDFYVEAGILLHQKASRSAMRVMAAEDRIDKDRAASLFLFSMLTMFFAPLRTRVQDTVTEAFLLKTYTHSLDELDRALVVRHDPAAPREVLDAMVWLWVMSDEFVPLLRVPTQEAVAIFAHFCVLLKYYESHWWLQGWGEHIMMRAREILDEEHRGWIEWPLREMGWMEGVEGLLLGRKGERERGKGREEDKGS
ncbi:hypothetical protein CHGG_00111 [Chaetomium globosum CBS 148.51]|uniref:Uncharacterized protein n=1 Tax=Chaetomium globosum (strain ATCC 6205 / CBS 148.51 / DSM 1962 / NBRC 6347 / NRRL 1970) TaxID=306901 RepID=Q2HI43_CHAGB|nr:uncharacterized protein CHGG_00111 [Chaetomium globosum CBS 148.51]EAQ91876.1 hypothetical protein CHGG_00111 [Chaetomium globosum CBS 148.51]